MKDSDLNPGNDIRCSSGKIIDFASAVVSHSNLGGAGPDTGDQNIRYEGIAARDGVQIDLIVTATSSYTPRDSLKNGIHGPFGKINVATDTEVDLLFSFVDNDGQPMKMDPFYFTIFDLDHGMSHESRERVTVTGFEQYRISGESEIEVTQLDDGAATFSSMSRGGKIDNPASPLAIDNLQRSRTVTLAFPEVDSFNVKLAEIQYADPQGRNFFFSGPSMLVCKKEGKCSSYTCPDGFKKRQQAEFLVCLEAKCSAMDRDTCCFEEEF